MKTSTALAVLLLSLVVLLGGCADDSSPRWIDGGTHIARVTEYSLPDTIMPSDTLRITLSATLFQPVGRPEFAHLETHRTAHILEVTVWANVDLWSGSGPMPPTDLTVLERHQHVELPPFPPGPFALVLTQPEGAAIADTVFVVAG